MWHGWAWLWYFGGYFIDYFVMHAICFYFTETHRYSWRHKARLAKHKQLVILLSLCAPVCILYLPCVQTRPEQHTCNSTYPLLADVCSPPCTGMRISDKNTRVCQTIRRTQCFIIRPRYFSSNPCLMYPILNLCSPSQLSNLIPAVPSLLRTQLIHA